MRNDSIGMFWQDLDLPKAKADKVSLNRPLPPIPVTNWAPRDFPNLAGAAMIGLDTETKDLDLLEKGPGVRRDGHLIGISVAVPEGDSWYFPMRHEICPEQNMDPAKVLAWARSELCREGQPKVGANLTYDLDYLAEEGVHVKGPFYDVQIAEPLIDENRYSYALDDLSQRHLGITKVKDQLSEWVLKAYGNKNYRAELWRCPPSLVGPYAAGDAIQPIQIWQKQQELIARDGLEEVLQIETDLIPMMLAMRRHGVRIDMARRQLLDDELTQAILLGEEKLKHLAGFQPNINAGADLKRMFDKLGVRYPYTPPSKRFPEGQPSFVKEWLEGLEHPAGKAITEIRTLMKYRDTFVRGYLDLQINGRIHCMFHQVKTDNNGTVSGRFSSSDPNLQNIPARDEYWGPLIRSMFLPEEDCDWVKHDWSQIEYRFLAHFGVGHNAEVVRQRYNREPDTDFHHMVMDMTGLPRKPAKTINFGLVYGMGKFELARRMGMTVDQAETEIFLPYHTEVPFVRDTYERAQTRAQTRGFMRTILGRRARFDLWEEGRRNWDAAASALPYDLAKAKWGQGIKRAFTHKALNRLLQGSAGDLMKKAMATMWRSGVYNVLPVMHLTVHDEADHSRPRTKEAREATNEIKRIMESVIKIKVPVVADEEVGTNWGNCKK